MGAIHSRTVGNVDGGKGYTARVLVVLMIPAALVVLTTRGSRDSGGSRGPGSSHNSSSSCGSRDSDGGVSLMKALRHQGVRQGTGGAGYLCPGSECIGGRFL